MKPGSTVVVFGGNGGGKSSLLLALLGELGGKTAVSGRVSIAL